MYKFEFEFLGVHCECCNDIMGHKFDCPICEEKTLADDIYDYLSEHFEEYDYFRCGKCKTIFTAKVRVGDYDEWEFDIV